MDENKNFEELEKEVEQELNDVEASVADSSEEVQEEVKSLVDQVKGALNSLKETVVNFDLDKDGVTLGDRIEEVGKQFNEIVGKATTKFNEDPAAQETVDKAKAGINSAYEKVVGKAKELYAQFNAEKVQETVDDAAEKVDETVDKVLEAGEDIYNKATENPEVKKVVDKVVEKGKEAQEYVADKYQEFIHDEKVRETVRNAKDSLTDLASKVMSGVKDLFGGKDEEE